MPRAELTASFIPSTSAELTPEVTAFTPFALTELTVGLAEPAPSPTPRGKIKEMYGMPHPVNEILKIKYSNTWTYLKGYR